MNYVSHSLKVLSVINMPFRCKYKKYGMFRISLLLDIRKHCFATIIYIFDL